MNSPNLLNIFENAVNQFNGLNNANYLKDLVNKYKNTKVKGEYIIKPTDFDVLQKTGGLYDDFKNDILNNPKEQYSNKNEYGRLFNLYQELKKRTKDSSLTPYLRKYYQDALDEFTNLIKNVATPQASPDTVNPIQVPNVTPTGNKTYSINNTKYLKFKNVIKIDQFEYQINDKMLSVFKSTNNKVNMYYDAIIKGDTSLKADANSSEGIVYNLFKGLKYKCQEVVQSYVELTHRMSQLLRRSDSNSNRMAEKNFIHVNTVDLDNLKQNDLVQIKYEILSEGVTFESIFKVYRHIGNYKLVNDNNLNNHFVFDTPVPIDGIIEKGYMYNTIYNSENGDKKEYKIKILDLKVSNTGGVATQFNDCDAADELITLIYNIRYGD